MTRAPGRRRLAFACVALTLAVGCDERGQKTADATGTSESRKHEPALRHGLTEQAAKQVLAKVGDRTLTVGEFAERLSNQPPHLRARYNDPERRREVLDEMVRFELLALEAEKRGHGKQPEVDRAQRQAMVEQMMKEMFDDQGVKPSDITDAEIKAYYEAQRHERAEPVAADTTPERSLEEARSSIQHLLWRQKRAAAIAQFLAALRTKASIKENLAMLDQIEVDLPAVTPAARPER